MVGWVSSFSVLQVLEQLLGPGPGSAPGAPQRHPRNGQGLSPASSTRTREAVESPREKIPVLCPGVALLEQGVGPGEHCGPLQPEPS